MTDTIPWAMDGYEATKFDTGAGRLVATLRISSGATRVPTNAAARSLAWDGFADDVRTVLAGNAAVAEYGRLRDKLRSTERAVEGLRDDAERIDLDHKALLRGADAGEKLATKLAKLAAKKADLIERLAMAEQGGQSLVEAVDEARSDAVAAIQQACREASVLRTQRLRAREAELRAAIVAAAAPFLVESAVVSEAMYVVGHATGYKDAIQTVLNGPAIPPAPEVPVAVPDGDQAAEAEAEAGELVEA